MLTSDICKQILHNKAELQNECDQLVIYTKYPVNITDLMTINNAKQQTTTGKLHKNQPEVEHENNKERGKGKLNDKLINCK